MLRSVNFPVTICVLCYGDHSYLAERFLSTLARHTERSWFHLRVGLNAVAAQTRTLVAEVKSKYPDTIVHDSESNLFKVPMMRRLLHDPAITSTWTVWFDDDSYVTCSDWLLSLAVKIEAHPTIAMWGKPYSVQVAEQTADFARSAPWYRGLPLVPSHEKPGYYRLSFVEGGFWAIKTDCLVALDWPDHRLVHYHNDFMLGEAMRQGGFPVGRFEHGVVVNGASRRSPAGVPAGP